MYERNGIDIILMAIHHRRIEVQFMVIQNSQINRGHFCKNGHKNDCAALACIPDSLPHGNVISGTVINNICFICSKGSNQCIAKVAVGCVDGEVCADRFCNGQTVI